MATAFWGTLVIKHANGTVEADRFDSSDVTAAYVTFKSNGGNTFYTVKQDGFITDIILNITAAGDTKYFKLYINQTDTGIAWVQSACFPNLATRFPQTSPIPVKANQQLLIQAVT